MPALGHSGGQTGCRNNLKWPQRLRLLGLVALFEVPGIAQKCMKHPSAQLRRFSYTRLSATYSATAEWDPPSRHLCRGPRNIHAAPPKHATMFCHARRHKKSHRGMQAPSMQACRTCSRCPARHLLRPTGAPWISTYKRSMMPKGIIFSYWAIHPAAGPAAGPTGT